MENRNMRDGSSRRNRLARGLTMVGVVGAMIVGFLPLGLGVTAAGAATATGGQYVPITPVRIADTRTGSTFPNAGQTMQAGGSVTVALPSSVAGASAVALNVTATNTTGSGFFTIYPTDGTLPLASSLNFSPGANVPNFVIVPVGANNSITIYNGPPGGDGSTGGAADAVVDLQGSFNTVANTSGGAGHFNPLTPARITDTRAGSGQTNAGMTLTAGGTLAVQATGQGGVPATGVSAVEVNVTEAANTAGGFLTVFPQGNTAPTVSNLNFVSGQIVANRVIVPVNPANGQFSIFNHAGNTDVLVDVDGYFTDSTGASGAGSLFNTVTPAPARVIDTRSSSPIGPNGNLNVPITGHNNVPAGASAAVLNVTEASNTAGGFLTVSPTTPAPLASDVNFVPGVSPVDPKVIVANGDIAALASDGSLNVYNHDGNTNVVLDVAGYFSTATPGPAPQTFVVTPGPSLTPLTPTASTSSAPSQGVESYSASGLPANTPVNIALFPCLGTAQTGNGPSNGAPSVNGSGQPTFTAPGNTTPQAGNAVGQGTTQANSTPSPAGYALGNSTGGGFAPYSSTAYVASVNGVPTANGGAAVPFGGTSGPTQVYGISSSNGTVSFVLNSFQTDCTIPIVYTAPASAGSTPALLVNANGLPQTGYAAAEGQATHFLASAAPASINGYNVNVVSVDAAASTFVGTVNSRSLNGAGGTYTFNYGPSGSTFYYTDGTPMTAAQFGSYLSGSNAGQVQPNTATPAPVPGDQVIIGGYAPGVATYYVFDTVAAAANPGLGEPAALGSGDVPNAPSNGAASYNGAAFTTGGISQPGVVVTWTPPVNPDVSGSEAVNNGTTPYTGNAVYTVWRSTVTNGTAGASTQVGTVTVIPTGTPNNGTAAPSTTSVSSPEFIDQTAPAGASVVYYVTATAATGNNGGGKTGPFSSASTATTAGTGLSTPAITAVTIVPGLAPSGSASATFPANTGEAFVTYQEPVTCLSAAGGDFSYSNSGGTPHPVAGASCSQAPAGNYNEGTSNEAKTLLIVFAPVTTTVVANVATYTGSNVVAPANGDAFTYTAPTTPTTANAVYAGTVSSPIYAATQTVSDNGQTNTGTTISNPLT